MKKNGFLFLVDMLKWEKFIYAQAFTSLMHYRGLLVFEYHRGINLIVTENKKSEDLRIFLSLEQQ